MEQHRQENSSMTIEYPYFTPIILTDSVFERFGGFFGNSTYAQRQASYLIAEMQMTSHLRTFLHPTTVTGTFPWPNGQHLALPYGYVISIPSVKVISQQCYCDCDTLSDDGCAFIYDDGYGYIDVRKLTGCCGDCGCASGMPYQVQVAWQSGLSTGTASQPNILFALTIVADITLKEMIDSGANEGVGDIGIQSFSNNRYSEQRVALGRNAFGTSARAQKAANLVAFLYRRRGLKF